MKKSNYFIIFGKNGKIAKSINLSFSIKNENVICLSWEVCKQFLNSRKNIKPFLEKNYKINSENYKLIFINCLRESTNLSSSLQLNKKLLNQFKEFNSEFKYIYFSTYEPNNVCGTNYRSIKKNMESVILANDGIVIRIGYFLSSDELNHNKNNSEIVLTNFNKDKILVPVTLSCDLITHLFLISNNENIQKLIKCYSLYCCINLVFSFPFLRVSNVPNEINKNYFPIPFQTVSRLLFYFAYILRYFKYNQNWVSFLEKPYSLALQQAILYKNKKVEFEN
tara:strand:- start:2957 stop:3796 length:840 start_codon:yes stop_codon:yes gene_type:complete